MSSSFPSNRSTEKTVKIKKKYFSQWFCIIFHLKLCDKFMSFLTIFSPFHIIYKYSHRMPKSNDSMQCKTIKLYLKVGCNVLMYLWIKNTINILSKLFMHARKLHIYHLPCTHIYMQYTTARTDDVAFGRSHTKNWPRQLDFTRLQCLAQKPDFLWFCLIKRPFSNGCGRG